MGVYQIARRVLNFIAWTLAGFCWEVRSSAVCEAYTSIQTCESGESVALAEKEAFSQLVHASGAIVPPSALVELENPLLIWGAIGGATVLAGVAAAGILLLGVAAITLPLLWYFGVFNSHKDRRRKNDELPPCDSTDPPDTNDPDCFALRFNKMTWYYSAHANLKRGEKRIVQGASEIEAMFDKVTDMAGHIEERMFGHGGTFGHPSKTSGVYHDVWLVSDSAFQLANIAENSMSSLTDASDGMVKHAESDVDTVRTNLNNAAQSLEDEALRVMELESQSQLGNTALMARASTRILSDAVTGTIDAQKEATDDLVDTNRLRKEQIYKMTLKSGLLGQKLMAGQDFVRKLEQRISTNLDSAKMDMDDSNLAVLNHLTDFSETNQEVASGQFESIVKEFNDQTVVQVKENQGEWTNLTHTYSVQAVGLTDSLQSDVHSVLNSQSLLLGNRSIDLADAMESATIDLEKESLHAKNSAASIANAGSLLSEQARSESSATKTDTDSIMQSIDRDILNLRSQVSDSFSSVRKGGSGLLGNALGNIQQDTSQVMTTKELKYTGTVVDILKQLGSSGISVGKLISDLVSAVAIDHSVGDGSLLGNISTQERVLLSSLNELARKLNTKNSTLNIGIQGSGDIRTVLAYLSGDSGSSQSSLENELLDTQERRIRNVSSDSGISSDILRVLSESVDSWKKISSLIPSNGASLYALALMLANGDDTVAKSLESELKFFSKQSNNTVRTVRDKQRIDSLVKHLNDAKSNSSRTAEQRVLGSELEKLADIISLARNVGAASDSSVSNTDKRVSEIRRLIQSQFGNLKNSDQQTLSLLFNARGIDPKSVDFVNQIIRDVIDRTKEDLSESSPNGASVSQVDGSEFDSVRRLIASLRSSPHAEEVSKKTSMFYKTVADNGNFTASELGNLQTDFEKIKTTTIEYLTNLTNDEWKAILSLPSELSSSFARLESDFSLSQSDYENRVRAAKEQLATSKTGEEKFAASRAVLVLSKLAGIQEGTRAADLLFRRQLKNLSGDSSDLRANIAGALAVSLGALEEVSTNIDSREKFSGYQITETETLRDNSYISLNQVLEQFGNQSLGNAVQAATSEAIRFAQERARTAKRTQGLVNRTSAITGVSEQSINDVSRAHAKVSGREEKISQISQSVNKSIDYAIEHVLDDIGNRTNTINETSIKIKDDVVSRIGATRLLLSALLVLLHEYGASTERELVRLVHGDSELLTVVEQKLQTALLNTQGTHNTTENQIVDLVAKLEAINSSRSDFKQDIEASFSDIVPLIRSIQADMNLQSVEFDSRIQSVLDLQTNQSGRTLSIIGDLLDSFSETITG
jgi:hypothetical protein